MLDLKEYSTVCSDFDYCVKENVKDGHCIVINRRTQEYTKTEDYILKVKSNRDSYIWHKI